MLFNSYSFLIFFPLVVLLTFVMPQRIRHIWLLLCSYFFYMCWNPAYILLILFSTVITYESGILIEKYGRQKWILVLSFASNLSVLFFFKYFEFFVGTFIKDYKAPFSVLLPVGISFYTFQALSYTADVYSNKIKAEKNFLYYALYVSFFPQLVAGPIERSDRLIIQLRKLSEIKRSELFSFDRIKSGLILMSWGYFLKMMIADRVSVIADTVFDNASEYGTIVLIAGALAFTIQIYCDFYSYSIIAKGCAKVVGVELMDNFDTPYFAQSIKEFWRRWHISLSTWFRDYLYIPLGGSRCSKLRKYFNLMVTFLVSGLWHGANWTFVVWGGIHGAYQVVEDLCKLAPNNKSSKIEKSSDDTELCKPQKVDAESELCKLIKPLNVLRTFILVAFAWIFFRAESIEKAFVYIGRMFTRWDMSAVRSGALLDLGLADIEIIILFISLLVLLLVSYIQKFKGLRIDQFIIKRNGVEQWLYLYLIVMIIAIFGVYGISESMKAFIYFQF